MSQSPLYTILLIEDDPGDALLIEEILEQQCCLARFVTAERLAEGISCLEHINCDAVLLDMNLPDSRGLSTVTRLIDAVPNLPIIILTGHSEETFAIDAVKSGAQDYLVKGTIDGKTLKRAILYAIERNKLEIALKQTRDMFEHQARIDYLTGIYNRLMFNELLEAELQRARRSGASLSLIMYDLDHFKRVNDNYGHTIGDHVLKEVAQFVSHNIRAHDIFARWGGEEFMVIIPNSDLSHTLLLAEKLRCLCESHDFGDGLMVTASFGVTQFKADDSAEDITVRADEAMYLAKKNGRNRVEAL